MQIWTKKLCKMSPYDMQIQTNEDNIENAVILKANRDMKRKYVKYYPIKSKCRRKYIKCHHMKCKYRQIDRI